MLKSLRFASFCALLVPFYGQAATMQSWLSKDDAVLVQPTTPYDGKAVQLKFSSPNPASSLLPNIWKQGFERLAEETNQKITIKEFHGGTLHSATDGWRAVRSQVSDYATCYTLYEGTGFPLHKAIEMPFVAPADPVVAARVLQSLAPKYFTGEWNNKGVLYGYTAIAGMSDIMSNKPIRTPDDLKGLRVIAQGFPPEAAKALGIVTLNIPFPEIYTALQQGMADAVIWVDAGFVPYKIYELTKYHTSIGLTAQHVDTCINKKSFDKVPTELKPTFAHFQQLMGHALSQEMGVNFRQKAQETYAANGVTLITLSPTERQQWKDVLNPVVQAWVAEQDKAGVPMSQFLKDLEQATITYTDPSSGQAMSAEQLFKITVEQPIKGILPGV